MYLKTLSLTQFKNYRSASLQFSPSLNHFAGRNGAGKTNLLDSIHYLCLGKSYFHASDMQSIRAPESFFRMQGKFKQDATEMDVSCTYSGGRKEVAKNGIVYQRLTEHVGTIPVVMIAPDDHSLIDEGSDERRRFIDNTISQIDHPYLDNLVAYNKVLQQRNAALKTFAIRRSFDAALLDTLNIQLSGIGRKIYASRTRYLQQFIPPVKKYHALVCGEKENIQVEYQSVFQKGDLLPALRNSIEKDRQLERTTEGIHRDELDFFLSGQPVKKFGSQGQKKTFLISLKLAQWELIRSEIGKTPILLLDDLFDKLDSFRAGKILNLIAAGFFGQVFITDTEAERLHNLMPENDKDYKYFHIEDGHVTESG